MIITKTAPDKFKANTFYVALYMFTQTLTEKFEKKFNVANKFIY